MHDSVLLCYHIDKVTICCCYAPLTACVYFIPLLKHVLIAKKKDLSRNISLCLSLMHGYLLTIIPLCNWQCKTFQEIILLFWSMSHYLHVFVFVPSFMHVLIARRKDSSKSQNDALKGYDGKFASNVQLKVSCSIRVVLRDITDQQALGFVDIAFLDFFKVND